MNEFEYLSDEELEKFIADVETDLVQAPPGLLDGIMAKVDADSEKAKPPMKTKEEKIVEYRRFRKQVIVSMTASIAASLLLPIALSYVPEMPRKERQIPTREEIVGTQDTMTKEEFLNRNKLNLLGGWNDETKEKE
ncbi:MAG: hypothetical protein E7297_04895 [Lachnospiraceae bacterium]|jgi:hypothetical protein|nr:hypothetical protein [Lachnospiraceae bacterium]